MRAAPHDERVDLGGRLEAALEDVGFLAQPRQGVICHAVGDQNSPGVGQRVNLCELDR